jgi:hypothetical protein
MTHWYAGDPELLDAPQYQFDGLLEPDFPDG